MVLLPVLGLLAGAGIAVALLQALTDPAPGSPANAAEQRDSGSIVLDADQYIGDPVGQVAARLTALGLDVELRKEVRDDVVPDRVTAVEPDGRPLSAGDTVVVTYAVGEPDTSTSSGRAAVTGASGGGDSPATEAGDTAGTTTAASPTTGAAEPTTDDGRRRRRRRSPAPRRRSDVGDARDDDDDAQRADVERAHVDERSDVLDRDLPRQRTEEQ